MDQETRVKRLRYRSWHRGCKETDIILGKFADEHMAAIAPALLDLYEELLEENDNDIWMWLTGKDVPEKYELLLEMLKKDD